MEERDLNLTARQENKRDKTISGVVRFKLDQILDHFKETIRLIEAHFETAEQLCRSNKTAEAEYIWRTQIVFVAGALDFYMHELTKFGLCRIYDGDWPETEKFNNIKLPLSILRKALIDRDNADWFLDYINDYYHATTMISNESIKEQFNLLGIVYKNVADSAFYQQGSTEKTDGKLKRRLTELFYRRNVIAHQTDRTHTDAEIKEISKETVVEYINDVKKIVSAIDAEARKTAIS